LQHSLTPKNQPVVAIKSETSGPLTGYYGLQAVFSEKGTEDFLWVRGLCRATGGNTGERAEFELALSNGAEGDPVPVKASESVAGVGHSMDGTQALERRIHRAGRVLLEQRRTRQQAIYSLADQNHPFRAADAGKNTLDAAQFIGFRQPGVLSRTRLNSLFGPELVQRSNVSVDAVLDWDTQFLTEPPPAAGPIDEPNGAFDGANGLYFWELFFHLPHLVATRLRAEDRYLEAQNWLHYVRSASR
jgi:hypothetical protein